MSKNFKEQVFEKVRKIPRGKVSTYGSIAEMLGKRRWSRQVGWALHQNTDPKTPCHRVVDRNGRLAPNFAFSARGGPANNRSTRRERIVPKSRVLRYGGDGVGEQRRRLEAENVRFRDKMHVDLTT